MRNIPFPQANNMDLLFRILFDIGPDGITASYVSEKYNLRARQGNYYLNALFYLGLVTKVNIKYFLSPKGTDIRLAAPEDQISKFCASILQHDFLGPLYKSCKSFNTKSEIVDHIALCIFNMYDLNPTTAGRRAESTATWFQWIDNNLYRNKNDGN